MKGLERRVVTYLSGALDVLGVRRDETGVVWCGRHFDVCGEFVRRRIQRYVRE